jgi:hypothetical protein
LISTPVVEPHPVVLRAAHPRRIFLQHAQARDGLARVEQVAPVPAIAST